MDADQFYVRANTRADCCPAAGLVTGWEADCILDSLRGATLKTKRFGRSTLKENALLPAHEKWQTTTSPGLTISIPLGHRKVMRIVFERDAPDLFQFWDFHHEIRWERRQGSARTGQFCAQKHLAAAANRNFDRRTARRLKQIEDGGAMPQWGPAGN